MSGDNKDVKLSLTVMLNKERNKVLYAVADNQFVDILFSFMTLPLGRIVKVLEKYYGEKAPTIGSLNSLYHGLANLDSSHFMTEGAKKTLLHLTSSFEAEYEKLKFDFTDSPPAEFFVCRAKCYRFRSVSMYYDQCRYCYNCKGVMSKEVVEKSSEAAAATSDGVFMKNKSYFVISNDLHVVPQEGGFLKIINILGITDTDNSESIKVDFGFSEIMDLFKASLTSPTPLSDVILHKATQMKINTSVVGSDQPKEDNPNCRKFILKVMIQKSTGKLLHAQTEEDFIPLGVLEHLLAGKNTCFKAICNMHRSAAEFMDNKYFTSLKMKKKMMLPNLVHGCISENHILPLTEECLTYYYNIQLSLLSSEKFPKGPGRYLQQSRTYQVKDDLTVEPYCFVSIFSSLGEQKILLSDVKEVELKIGLKEALSILEASLTSTSALSDALLNHTSLKQPKREL